MEKISKYISKKLGRGFTFLVVPNSSAGVKSILIPISLAVVILTVIVFNIYIYFGYTTQIWTIFHLRQVKHIVEVKNRQLLREQREVKPTLKKSYQMVDELNDVKKKRIRIDTSWKSIQPKGG